MPGIAMMMADAAVARWDLRKLNRGRRHSAAWFIGAVVTEHAAAGVKTSAGQHGADLTARQVRCLLQIYGRGFGKWLADCGFR
jgi:hypothetical protein